MSKEWFVVFRQRLVGERKKELQLKTSFEVVSTTHGNPTCRRGNLRGQVDERTKPQRQFERRYRDSLTYVSGDDVLFL
jgi:hypothetical protein